MRTFVCHPGGNEHTFGSQIGVSKSILQLKNNNKMIPGPQLGKYKINLKHSVMTEKKGAYSKIDRDISKE